MASDVIPRKRLTREESRAQTRERLLDAALEVFVKDGIEAPSIEDLAETAGYSRGAFYSNFESKDDLLCAVLEREIQRDTEQFDAIVSAPIPVDEIVNKLRESYVMMAQDDAHCAFLLGLQLYSLRNAAIRPKVAELMRKKREHVIDQARRVYAAMGKEPPGSIETVSFGLIAIAQGLCVTRLLDPDAVSAELLPKSLETLFNQVTGSLAIS